MAWGTIASVGIPLLSQLFASQRSQPQFQMDPQTRMTMDKLMTGPGLDPRSVDIMTERARTDLGRERERMVGDAEQSMQDRGMWRSSLVDEARTGIDAQHSDALARAYANIAQQDAEMRHQQQVAGTQMASEWDRWQQAADQQQQMQQAQGWADALVSAGANLVYGIDQGDFAGWGGAIADWLGGLNAPPAHGSVEQTTPGQGAQRTAGAGAQAGTPPPGNWGAMWPQHTGGAGMRTAGPIHGGQPMHPYPAPYPTWQNYNPQFGMT